MDGLAGVLLSLPSFAIYAIVGGIAGALGALCGYAVEKIFHTKNGLKIISVVFVVVSVQVTSKLIMPYIYQSAAPTQAVRVMKQQSRLFNVIFKYHPGAEDEAINKMKAVLAGPRATQSVAARAVGAEIANRYFETDVLMASDEAVRRTLQSALSITVALKNKPDTCVAMWLGTSDARIEEIPKNILNEEVDAKADVIETAFTRPSPPPKNVSLETIVSILAASYRKNHLDVEELRSIGSVGTLPAPQACQIVDNFLTTLISMSSKDSALVYKWLIAANK